MREALQALDKDTFKSVSMYARNIKFFSHKYHPLNQKQYSTQLIYKEKNMKSTIKASKALIDQGGLKSKKSSIRRTAGMAWKPRSGTMGSIYSGGNTNSVAEARWFQYRMLTTTSKGAAQTESMFLTLLSRLLG